MPASLLPIERDSSGPFAGVAVVRLEQPGKPVVVLDLGLIQRLEATLAQLGRDPAIRGMVLASASERVFVAGADLKTISEASDAELHRYLEYAARIFAMVCRLPFPTVAAINGAALGGGLELAMHCSGLVAAPSASGKPYPVGLPEAGLGLCPGWGGTNLLPARVDPAEAIGRTAAGKTFTFDEAVALRMFDRVAPSAGELVPAAKTWLVENLRGRRERDGTPERWIGRPQCAADVLRAFDGLKHDLPATESARAVAECVETGLTHGWEAATEAERRHLVRLRARPEAKAALEAFFAKSGAKG